MWHVGRLSDSELEDRLADNMDRMRRLAAVLCSITRDINFELEQQIEQCTRIIDKVTILVVPRILQWRGSLVGGGTGVQGQRPGRRSRGLLMQNMELAYNF